MRNIRFIAASRVILEALMVITALSGAALAQGNEGTEVPSLIEVYWKSSRSVALPGISNVIVLDQEISRAETGADVIQFYGLERGETIALGYRNSSPVTMRIRVIARPPAHISPSLQRGGPEMAQGSISSNVQGSSGGGRQGLALLNGVFWSQAAGANGRLDFGSEVEDNNLSSNHDFNIRRAALSYRTQKVSVHALDFTVNLMDGGPQQLLTPLAAADSTELRGLGVTLNRGDDQYTFYAGTTIPFFYLTLGSTRDLAGFSFLRRRSARLALFANSTFLNAPIDLLGTNAGRRNSLMQTIGLSYRLDDKWTMNAAGGASNRGGMIRGELAYTSSRLTAFAAARTSSVLFPLNQIASLFSGASSLNAGLTLRSNYRLMESVSYQHTVTKAVGGIRGGSSDYLNPGLSIRLSRSEELAFNYAYTHNSGGFGSDSSRGNRFDTGLHSQWTPRVSNTAEVTVGSLQDPFQLNSQDQFSVRDAISLPVKHGNLFVAAEHDRTSPSLVQKLQSELSLLTPSLQALFLQDPVSFVSSSVLPPEIRAILTAQQPVSTSVSAAGQFNFGRMALNPNFSMVQASNGIGRSWSPLFGYGLTYGVRPTLQLNSSMSNTWILGRSQGIAQRTTVVSFGMTKNFSAQPDLLLPTHHSRVIEGRVFRDRNLNGTFNVGEPGFAGIQVQLEDGETALTDEDGRFKFTGVSAGEHQVSIGLSQFHGPVRMTTPSQIDVTLIRQRIAVVNFGVIDFARLMGAVFNDLRLEGKRSPDAKGLPEVRLILDDGKVKRAIVVEGSGEYEVNDIVPGDYRLSVDADTVPANYVAHNEGIAVHVAPVSTVVRDVPVTALRSIAGAVFLKVPAQAAVAASAATTRPAAATTGEDNYQLVPMAGVQLTAGYGFAVSDQNGRFLLRNLPAGDLTVSLVPFKPMPEAMKLPSGLIRMPPEPVQVQGAKIVISNPELVPYLVGKSAEDVRRSALEIASSQ